MPHAADGGGLQDIPATKEGMVGLLFRRRRIVPHAGNRGVEARHYRLRGSGPNRAADAEAAMQSHVRVAVIGGGVVGCSVLYHLTRLGWRDVMLIERSESTSGSTWRAAGAGTW